MRSGEELDLVVTVSPDVGETDDLVCVGHDERVEPGICIHLMEPGDHIVRGVTRDPLVGERAGVEKRAELDGVGIRRRTRLEELGQGSPFREVRTLATGLSEPTERGGAGLKSFGRASFRWVERTAPAYQRRVESKACDRSACRLLEDELEAVDLVHLRPDLDEARLADQRQ